MSDPGALETIHRQLIKLGTDIETAAEIKNLLHRLPMNDVFRFLVDSGLSPQEASVASRKIQDALAEMSKVGDHYVEGIEASLKLVNRTADEAEDRKRGRRG